MKKVIFQMSVSLDGYIEGPHHEIGSMVSTPLPSPMAEAPKALPACGHITARTFMRRMYAIRMATSSLRFAAAIRNERRGDADQRIFF
jgi:hypothetical protein